MILTLENFRCYKGIHKWNFDSDGITLISGSSGAGKSTLLMAIFFVITGSSPSKIITDGCDSCSVSLELLDYTIKRTKRPNRLVVSQEHSILEDEVAQELIYRIFGRYYEFTSYIQQQYQKTFLYLSPSEKLEILEKLCFDSSEQPETLKKECISQIKTKQEECINLKSKIQILESWIKQPIDPPLQPNTTLDRSIILDRLKELEDKQKQLEQFQNLQNMYKQKQLELAQLQPIDLQQDEQFLNQQLYIHNEFKNIKEKNYSKPWEKYSKNEAEELHLDYLRDIKLLREYKQLETKINHLLSYEETLNQLKQQYEEIRATIEGIYSCPKCKQKICLLNNNLFEYDHTYTQVVDHEKKKELLKRIEQKINAIQPHIIELERHKQTILEIEEQVNTEEDIFDLENDLKWIQEYIQQQTELERKYDMWVMRMKDIESTIDPLLNTDIVSTMLNQIKQIQHIQSTLNMIEKELKKLDTFDVSELSSNKLKSEKDRLLLELEKQNELEIYKIKKEKYEQYIQNLERYNQFNTDLKKTETQLEALAEFKNIIAKTESDIIEQEIARVCELVNQIISEIFSEPIIVELKTTKKTSTNNEKIQIQLQVYYKNMCTDISILSGGELARLNLAFTLAFASITESRLVLLDECTANLDTELTEIVIEQIKKLNIPKVILIAHQVVEGTFQQIIRIENKQ
jgi:DNA repair exonuclease SbcCD ATPase subunit